MEIKELNKTQLILLSLLITFVVSIATGIVTVSLMQKAPKSVPQTINNVIQRTIEKVTTVQVPSADSSKEENVTDDKKSTSLVADGNVMVSIYSADEKVVPIDTPTPNDPSTIEVSSEDATSEEIIPEPRKALGQGIIISDVGLILVESSILSGHSKFIVVLEETDFSVSILKKFNNGFTILKIISKQEIDDLKIEDSDSTGSIDNTKQTVPQTIPKVDNQ